jgi:hypothetical protein
MDGLLDSGHPSEKTPTQLTALRKASRHMFDNEHMNRENPDKLIKIA